MNSNGVFNTCTYIYVIEMSLVLGCSIPPFPPTNPSNVPSSTSPSIRWIELIPGMMQPREDGIFLIPTKPRHSSRGYDTFRSRNIFNDRVILVNNVSCMILCMYPVMVIQNEPPHDTQKKQSRLFQYYVYVVKVENLLLIVLNHAGMDNKVDREIYNSQGMCQCQKGGKVCYDGVYALFLSSSSSVERGAVVVVVVLPLAGCLGAADAAGTPPPVVGGRPSSSRSSAKS